MNEQRLKSMIDRFPETHILVVGDYFLDFYLDLDRTLSETSLETGLEAYQVVGVRSSPGAAGTVTSNLRALDVQVTALGVIGDDGLGYELLRGLRERGVDAAPLIRVGDRFTPTYTKPMMNEPDGHVHELNRLDIKNRQPIPAGIETRIVAALGEWIGRVDGVIVADQVQERNCGVITDRVRAELADLALSHPDVVIAADSRVRIGEYRNLILKPNAREATLALEPHCELAGDDEIDRDACGTRAFPAEDGWISERSAEASARDLCHRNGKPVFLTIGADGILVCDRAGTTHVPGIRVKGPIDIVGAGDSTMAGIVSALCCGATHTEAALVGNLVASITIQQIGTTGTASREQVLKRFQEIH